MTTPSGSSSGLPENLKIESNIISDLTGTTYPGTAFYVDSLKGNETDGTTSWNPIVNPEEVTFQYNNLENGIEVDIGNKHTSKTLTANNNWFGTDGMQTSGDVVADYETKHVSTVAEDEEDRFGVISDFHISLVPDTYDVTTELVLG
jgi:hypothetical protein